MGLHRSESFQRNCGQFTVCTIRSHRVFEGESRELIVDLKYGLVKNRAHIIGQRLWSDFPDIGDADVLTWIPTLRERRDRRGFDHAEQITRHLSVLSDVPVRSLLRRTSSGYQTGKSRQERRGGVRFVAHPHCLGRRVCVIDDVCTTGSTFRAASQALVDVGASHVLCFSFAYVL